MTKKKQYYKGYFFSENILCTGETSMKLRCPAYSVYADYAFWLPSKFVSTIIPGASRHFEFSIPDDLTVELNLDEDRPDAKPSVTLSASGLSQLFASQSESIKHILGLDNDKEKLDVIDITEISNFLKEADFDAKMISQQTGVAEQTITRLKAGRQTLENLQLSTIRRLQGAVHQSRFLDYIK